MEREKSQLEQVLYYQKKYGKRGKEPWNEWVLRKRSINIGMMVVFAVENLDFSDFELALYFRCDDPKARRFVRAFEGQMEEAAINPELFVKNLDEFYRKNCIYIEENFLFREFYEFCKLLEKQRRLKISQGHKAIFDAYISLLMQQACYFSRRHLDDSVIGVTENGELIFKHNPNPYCDLPAYALESYNLIKFVAQTPLDFKVRKAYKEYGYDVRSRDDIELIEGTARVYDNNLFTMVPYINERNLNIVPQEPYSHGIPTFPREWKTTEYYREKLKHRSYLLPVSGVTATYVNAGDLDTIYYLEIMYKDEIVLLYRVCTQKNGEYSGYYETRSQIFFSIYQESVHVEWHKKIENFILENYMILTCPYEIDRKRNLAMKQTETGKTDFHYPNQPLVLYTYRKETGRAAEKSHKTYRYVKEEYQEEMISRSGYIRNLPLGQSASFEAAQRAAKLGLELPPGKTYVRSHEFKVYRKAFSSNEETKAERKD